MVRAGFASTYHGFCSPLLRTAICVSGKNVDAASGPGPSRFRMASIVSSVGCTGISYESFTGGMVPSGWATACR